MSMTKVADSNPIPRLAHRLFLFACLFTWPLLFLGGLVTTYKVGMSVPDWPTTFGINMFLYDFFNAAWGVFIEHGHRLYGSAVGLCLLILAPWIQCMSKVPARFKVATWLALAGVIFQGLMGGLRVTQISTSLAMIHGCFAQLFFMYLACITAWSSRTWIQLDPSKLGSAERPSRQILRFTIIMPFMFYSQIIVGAWLRHFQSPDKLYLHEILGVTVVVLTTIAGSKIRRSEFGKQRSIRRIRTILVGLTHLQWLLGLFSWWLMRPFDGIPKPVSSLQAILRTSHQANGALLLACAGVLALWVVRAYGLGQSQVPDLTNSAKMEAVCLS